MLLASGWASSYNGNGHLTVRVNGQSDVAVLNRRLVESGIPVYGLHMAQPSLEDIFLTLTAKAPAAGCGHHARTKGTDHEELLARARARNPQTEADAWPWAWHSWPRCPSGSCWS